MARLWGSTERYAELLSRREFTLLTWLLLCLLQLIHSLNKNASALVETDFWKQCQLEKRHNILLLGDSLGDSNMANGLDFKEDEIVRIGFLNDGSEEKLDLYLQRFDVVLTKDSSLLPVELLLHQIQV
jgi:hypothetical protein